MGGSQKRSSPFFSNKTYFFVLNPTQELKGAFWILRAKDILVLRHDIDVSSRMLGRLVF